MGNETGYFNYNTFRNTLKFEIITINNFYL